MTMNDTWGFSSHDHNWKSAETLVRNLIDCASKGGNYLLNVGPTPEGEIPVPSVERLSTVGKWLKMYGEAIYKTQAGPFPKALPWGRVTAKKGVLYCHVLDPSLTEIELVGFKGRIKRVAEIGADGGGSLMIGQGEAGPILPIGEGPDRDAAIAQMPRVIVVEVEPGFTIEAPVLRQGADLSLELKAAEAKTNGSNAAYEAAKNCIGFWTSQSDTVEWEFDARRGEVGVEIEIACPEDSAGATFEVQVSGQTLKGTVAATGGWDKFVKVNLGKVSIVAPGRTKLVVKPTSKPGYAVMNLRAVRLKGL